HPFLQPVPVSQLRVLPNGTDTSQSIGLSEAASQGLLSGTLWRYSQESGFTAAEQMEPWNGYWIRAEADVLLLVPAVASPGQQTAGALPPGNPIVGDTRSRARRADSANGWRLRLIARTGRAVGNLVVGACAGASAGFDPLFDARRPPDLGDYVRLGVRHDDWGRSAGEYAIDMRSLHEAGYSWEVDLCTTLRNTDVTLQWPDLSALPRDLRVTLTDLDGGTRRYLRTTGSLTINSGETGRRRLRLEVTRGGNALLAISNVTVSPTRARNGLEVRFDLSSAALVDAQIVSPTGRVLREITRGRASPAGTNQLAWDGRTNTGTGLPAGIYMLQLTATTEEGESVRAVRPVVLTR
ncbi:MAG: FlgD immunoglobulin-like domain containing protein, partial [Armatimonadota bacterium]|nr:FlgD immunoglobulin-like domain containing protein [Armatimonadota bacterium]